MADSLITKERQALLAALNMAADDPNLSMSDLYDRLYLPQHARGISASVSGLSQSQVDARIAGYGDTIFTTPAEVTAAVNAAIAAGGGAPGGSSLTLTDVDNRINQYGDTLFTTPVEVTAAIQSATSGFLDAPAVDARIQTYGSTVFATPVLVDQKIAAAGTGSGLSQSQVDARVTAVGKSLYFKAGALANEGSVDAVVLGAFGDYPGHPGFSPGAVTVHDDRAAIQAALDNAWNRTASQTSSTSHWRYLNDSKVTVKLPPGTYYIGLANANGTIPSLNVPNWVVFDYSDAELYFEVPKVGTYGWCGIQLNNYAHIRRGNTYAAPARADNSSNSWPDGKEFYDALRVVNTDGDSIVDDSMAVIQGFQGAAVGLFAAFITGVIGGQIRSCNFDIRASNLYYDNPFGLTIPNESDGPSYSSDPTLGYRMVTDVFIWGKRHTIKCKYGMFAGTYKGQTGSELVADFSHYNTSVIADNPIIEDVSGPAFTVVCASFVRLDNMATEEVGGQPGLSYANSIKPVIRVDNTDRLVISGDWRWDMMGNVGTYPGPAGTITANPNTLVHVTSVQNLQIDGIRAHNTYLTRTLTLAADASAGSTTIQTTAAPVAAQQYVMNNGNGEAVFIESWSGSASPYTCKLSDPLGSSYTVAGQPTLRGSSVTVVEGVARTVAIGASRFTPYDNVPGNGYEGMNIQHFTAEKARPLVLLGPTSSSIPKRYLWVDANSRLRIRNGPPSTQDIGGNQTNKDFSGFSLHRLGKNRVYLTAGRYFFTQPGANNTGTPTLNNIFAHPVTFGRTTTIDYVGLNATTAGTAITARVALCKADSQGLPDINTAFGEVTATANAAGMVTFTPSWDVIEGEEYFILFCQQGTTGAQFSCLNQTTTEIGITSTPAAGHFTAATTGVLVGNTTTTGTIVGTAVTSWNNPNPSNGLKIAVRASS